MLADRGFLVAYCMLFKTTKLTTAPSFGIYLIFPPKFLAPCLSYKLLNHYSRTCYFPRVKIFRLKYTRVSCTCLKYPFNWGLHTLSLNRHPISIHHILWPRINNVNNKKMRTNFSLQRAPHRPLHTLKISKKT